MARLRSRRPIRAALVPALAFLVVAMFAGYAVGGPNGLLRLGDYQRQARAREAELVTINAERARLENRKSLIARGDPDLADEMVRGQTDMIGNDQAELVVH